VAYPQPPPWIPAQPLTDGVAAGLLVVHGADPLQHGGQVAGAVEEQPGQAAVAVRGQSHLRGCRGAVGIAARPHPSAPAAAAAPYLGALGAQAPQGRHRVGEQGADGVRARGAVAGAMHQEDDVTAGVPADCGYREGVKQPPERRQGQPVPVETPVPVRSLTEVSVPGTLPRSGRRVKV